MAAQNKSLYETLGKLLSRDTVKGYEKSLYSAGMEYQGEAFAGYLLVNTLLFGLIVFMFLNSNLYIGSRIYSLTTGLVPGYEIYVAYLVELMFSLLLSWFLFFILVNSLLELRADSRRNAVESVLPDFLMLISSNVRAGMTIDQAMWYSAKPEFGILSVEVKKVIKEAFSGQPLDESLDKLAMRFNSRVFSRAMLLIKQASETGGEVATVLERTAKDARDSLLMRKEVASSLIIYEIFILFASMVGTPFLFAVAGKLIGVLQNAFGMMGPSGNITGSVGGGSMLSTFSNVSFSLISSTDFFYFSLATIFVTTLFSAFILGVIRAGSRNEGIKYLPFMLVAAYFIYFLISSVLDSFMGTLFV